MVKSLQRGVVTLSTSKSSTHTVNISSVDMNKSILVCNSANFAYHKSNSSVNSYKEVNIVGHLVSDVQIAFEISVHTSNTNDYDTKVEWQVIEFN